MPLPLLQHLNATSEMDRNDLLATSKFAFNGEDLQKKVTNML